MPRQELVELRFGHHDLMGTPPGPRGLAAGYVEDLLLSSKAIVWGAQGNRDVRLLEETRAHPQCGTCQPQHPADRTHDQHTP
jgi:hypothetical protein